jgi:hypothetical protein
MIEEITVFVKCDICDKKVDLDKDHSINIHCDDCIDKIELDNLECLIKEILNNRAWENNNYYSIYYLKHNKEYEKYFMRGFKAGIFHALHVYAEQCGDEGVDIFNKITEEEE